MKYWLGLVMSVASVVAAAPPPVVPSADTHFQDRETRVVPDFQRHVVPLLGRLGCNSAKCHGSFQGQADFRLSLFGFDFAADHAAMIAESTTEEGMRISTDAPEQSLILLKATAQIDHEGGQRFQPGSWEHHLLLRWIESGAKPTFINTSISANTAPGGGGGVLDVGSGTNPGFIMCSISNNQVYNNNAYGILINASGGIIDGNHIYNNVSDQIHIKQLIST